MFIKERTPIMPILDLSFDEVLTTTRAVRKRLDLTRPVEAEVIRECLSLAVQAPTPGGMQNWHFVVVTDPAQRSALAALYRKSAHSPGGQEDILKQVIAAAAVEQSAHWGEIWPATWSFMLAARSRGLGTVLTTLHLDFEQEAADVLGIPYAQVMQIALIPVAYTLGTA